MGSDGQSSPGKIPHHPVLIFSCQGLYDLTIGCFEIFRLHVRHDLLHCRFPPHLMGLDILRHKQSAYILLVGLDIISFFQDSLQILRRINHRCQRRILAAAQLLLKSSLIFLGLSVFLHTVVDFFSVTQVNDSVIHGFFDVPQLFPEKGCDDLILCLIKINMPVQYFRIHDIPPFDLPFYHTTDSPP